MLDYHPPTQSHLRGDKKPEAPPELVGVHRHIRTVAARLAAGIVEAIILFVVIQNRDYDVLQSNNGQRPHRSGRFLVV